MNTKTKWNFLIDAVMFADMMLIAGIGFLLKYALPRGGHNSGVGRSGGLSILGLTRHEWGDVHLIVAVFFLILLVVHIILHWGAICRIFSNLISSGAVRIAAALSFAVLCAALITFPFFIKPVVHDAGIGHELNGRNLQNPTSEQHNGDSWRRGEGHRGWRQGDE